MHHVGVPAPVVTCRTPILMEERHHWVGMAVVQRRRRPPARRGARHGRQPAQHHRLLLGPIAVLLLLLRQSVAADWRLPVEPIEALVVVAGGAAVVVAEHVVAHAWALLEHLRGGSQVRDVHAELDQQRKMIWNRDFKMSNYMLFL